MNRLVAQMTAANAPSPLVASASSEFSATYAAWKGFDRSALTWWFSGLNPYPAFHKIDLGTAQTATAYTVYPDDQIKFKYACKSWKFQGSNNDSDWTDLDTQSNITDWMSGYPKFYRFTNSTAYRYYRILISAGASTDYVGIRELGVNVADMRRAVGWDGDSLGTDYQRLGTETTVMYLVDPNNWDSGQYFNVAVAGATIAEQAALAAANVDSQLASLSAYSEKVLCFQCGINDVDDGESAATVLTRLSDYVAARITAGWNKVLVYTLIKAATITGDKETVRTTYNAALLASPPTGSKVIDIASLTEFSDTSDTTYYQADGVHLTVTGASVVATATATGYPMDGTAPTATLLTTTKVLEAGANNSFDVEFADAETGVDASTIVAGSVVVEGPDGTYLAEVDNVDPDGASVTANLYFLLTAGHRTTGTFIIKTTDDGDVMVKDLVGNAMPAGTVIGTWTILPKNGFNKQYSQLLGTGAYGDE